MRLNKILFLTLKVFSATGGIEKVSKIICKVLSDFFADKTNDLSILSMHDDKKDFDQRYVNSKLFSSYHSNKIAFGFSALKKGIQSDIIILSHCNLLFFGVLIKLFRPATKLVLIVHGIEVWKPFSKLKTKWLKQCDTIISVSQFTKIKMIELHKIHSEKIRVINNCLDPFLRDPAINGKSQKLLNRYGLTNEHKIILTLSRLSAHDRDKGYEKVLYSLSELKTSYPNLVYMIAGKYEPEEKKWIDELIKKYELRDKVIITGYVADDELAQHIELCDLYVMPSIKEGFGIIFIEALFYGKPVIGGNKDGSVDALANGKFGQLVNPSDQEEITKAISNILQGKINTKPDHNEVLEYFGYNSYKRNFLQALELN